MRVYASREGRGGVVWKRRDYELYSTNSSYHLDLLWFFFYYLFL